MNKYYVTMSISGTITIEINCNGNEEEAEKKANESNPIIKTTNKVIFLFIISPHKYIKTQKC